MLVYNFYDGPRGKGKVNEKKLKRAMKLARSFANEHEVDCCFSSDQLVDSHNNARGRRIGADYLRSGGWWDHRPGVNGTKISQRILEAMSGGKLRVWYENDERWIKPTSAEDLPPGGCKIWRAC